VLLVSAACFPTSSPDTASPLDSERRSSSATAGMRPFIVNWAPTDRTALETRAGEGPLIVRYDSDARQLELLPRCRVEGAYRFAGSSHASQSMKISTQAELGTKLPFMGPVNLGAMLDAYGELTVEYHSIGEYRLGIDSLHVDDLTGDCRGATHVLTSLSVGAFEFFAGNRVGGGASAEMAGVGVSGGGSKSYEHLDRGGDKEACESATRAAAEPPNRCDSVLAVELLPIARNSPWIAGETWEGHYECGGRKAISRIEVKQILEDGSVEGVLAFDYADDVGSYMIKGLLDAGTGEMGFEFVEWQKQPPNFVPVNFAGRLSETQNEYRGTVSHDGCKDFSYVRRQ
jgi:hypothetical protein